MSYPPNEHLWAKKLPKEWHYEFLSELISEYTDNRGRTVPTSIIGIPLIATNCIFNDSLFPKFKDVRYVSKDTYDNWFRRGHPIAGDLIFVNKGTPGQTCMISEQFNFCFAQDMIGIRANEKKITNRFLLAVIRSSYVQREIDAFHVGTLISHFKKSDFDSIIIPVPTKPLQEKIGDAYYNLSLGIKSLEDESNVLKKIIQSIFQSWFIDFDEVTEFQDSELGEIPKNWKIVPIGTLAKFVKGFSYKGIEKFQEPKEFVFVTLNNIIEGGGFKKKYAWLESNRLKERHFVKELDLVIANTEQTKDARLLATPAFVQFPFDYEKKLSVYSHHLTKVIPQKDNVKFYLGSLILFKQYEIANAYHTGTGVWGLDHDSFEEQYLVIQPPPEKLEEFEEIAENIQSNINNIEKRISILMVIRDSLLEKSLSRKIKWECS